MFDERRSGTEEGRGDMYVILSWNATPMRSFATGPVTTFPLESVMEHVSA